MKNIVTLISSVVFVATAIAQPQITLNNMPQLGDHVTIGLCSDIPNPTSLDAETGANYTWDFSTLTESEEQYFDFVEPSSTYWPNTYQNSNVCGVSWEEGYSFYNISGNALTTEGNKVIINPGDTASIIYTDQEQIVPIPYSMGTTFSDNFAGTGYLSGFNVSITGTLDFEADGYGTLVLPNATYQNVVRYRFDRVQNNTVLGFPPNQQTKTQWGWVSANHRFWLLLIEVSNDGFSDSHLTWFDKTPLGVVTGIKEGVDSERPIFYPNPIAGNGVLQLSSALSADDSVQLFDTQGRMVENINATTSTIALNGVNAGVYILRVMNSNAHVITTQKLIVQ
ncbi:MAG: T9SS type A sorting domain-containing protein [Flavobacteriales bacterium]|nr:T9SS type A sorting domain-containing protein [Flavobacteriales bacterium]